MMLLRRKLPPTICCLLYFDFWLYFTHHFVKGKKNFERLRCSPWSFFKTVLVWAIPIAEQKVQSMCWSNYSWCFCATKLPPQFVASSTAMFCCTFHIIRSKKKKFERLRRSPWYLLSKKVLVLAIHITERKVRSMCWSNYSWCFCAGKLSPTICCLLHFNCLLHFTHHSFKGKKNFERLSRNPWSFLSKIVLVWVIPIAERKVRSMCWSNYSWWFCAAKLPPTIWCLLFFDFWLYFKHHSVKWKKNLNV